MNVAVTRARKEIVICFSFEPEDLPAERSNLEFESPLEEQVQKALTGMGYEVDT